VALVGANGAGKSTLLRVIAGAHVPANGRVIFADSDITGLRAHQRVHLGIALVPEGRRLFTDLTVEENLLVSTAKGSRHIWNIEAVLETFPLLRPRLKTRAGNLSGGEQQATAIGRALMANPRVLLLDEVSLGLSPLAVEGLYRSLRLLREEAMTMVLVEQDLTRALQFASRVVCMLEGRIILDGMTARITRKQVTKAYFGLNRTNSAP
jgi:branched-chain amino acid transport system ATP-binding protein